MRREWLENHLARQLDTLPFVLGGASEADLSRRPSPGKWSVRDHLAHIARYHEVTLARVERMLNEDRPVLERYLAEQDPDWPAWSEKALPEVLERLRELRGTLVGEFKALPESGRSRVGVHPKFGAMSVAEWLAFFLIHEGHHLYVIMSLRGTAVRV